MILYADDTTLFCDFSNDHDIEHDLVMSYARSQTFFISKYVITQNGTIQYKCI